MVARLALGALNKGSKLVTQGLKSFAAGTKKRVEGVDYGFDTQLGRFLTGLDRGEKANPAAKLLFGTAAAGPLYDVLGPLGGGLKDYVWRPDVQQEKRFNNYAELYRIKKEKQLRADFFKTQMKMQEAVRQLATFSPQKYQELLAGKRLPQDAVVFGGTPRTDLLQQFANDVAMGNFQRGTITGQSPNPLEALGIE